MFERKPAAETPVVEEAPAAPAVQPQRLFRQPDGTLGSRSAAQPMPTLLRNFVQTAPGVFVRRRPR